MEIVRIITNKPLAKLWDFMTSYNCKSEVNSSDVLKAFQECDAALTELEEDRDHWKTMYGNACQELLDTANRQLIAENADLKKEIKQRRKEADGLYKALDLLRDEKEYLEQKIRDQEKEYKSLQGLNFDIITKHNEEMRQLREENDELRKDNEALGRVIKRNIDITTVNRNTIYQLREDNEALKRVIDKDDDIEKLDHMLQDLQKEYDKLKNDYGYLKNSRDAWRIRAEHAEADAEELKKRLMETTDILEKTNRDRNEWRRRALMTKLTSTVPDVKEEYTMTFTMDKDVYKDLMKLLLNKSFGASTEYMRAFLKEFCKDHDSCRVCPLKECGSDLGSGFDSMSDEEIEKYYKIAIRCYT